MEYLKPYQTLGRAAKELEEVLGGTKFYFQTESPRETALRQPSRLKVRGVTVNGVDFIVGAKRHIIDGRSLGGYLFYHAAPWSQWLADPYLRGVVREDDGTPFPAVASWRLLNGEDRAASGIQNALFLINQIEEIEIKARGRHELIRPVETLGPILRNYDQELRAIRPDEELHGVRYSTRTKESIVACTKLALELSAKHINPQA